MPKFEEEEKIGEGVIRLTTIKKGKEFLTSSEVDFKDLNTEGVISELEKIAKNLYENDLCSDKRTCEECGKLIPNHFVNTLCWDCYKKVDEANKAEERIKKMEEKTIMAERVKKEQVKQKKEGENDISPLG